MHLKLGEHLSIINCVEVHPTIIRKTPKFPSRERNLAIKRRKNITPLIPKPNADDRVVWVGDNEYAIE